MDKLISLQAAIDTLKELTANGTNKGMVFGEDAVHRIEILPSVQPDIIHCKDCKFYTAYDYTGKLMCKRIGKGMILPKPEDYCSYAERITDG